MFQSSRSVDPRLPEAVVRLYRSGLPQLGGDVIQSQYARRTLRPQDKGHCFNTSLEAASELHPFAGRMGSNAKSELCHGWFPPTWVPPTLNNADFCSFACRQSFTKRRSRLLAPSEQLSAATPRR